MKLNKISTTALISVVISMGAISFANADNTDKQNQLDQNIAKHSSTINYGWVQENNNWNFYKNNEKIKQNWLRDNGRWYYFDENGVMISYESKQIGERIYVFGKSGAMVESKGWIKAMEDKNIINNYGESYFYSNGDGTVKKNDWVKDNGKWYYFNPEGVMLANQIVYDGKMYALDANGAMIAKNGWIKTKEITYSDEVCGVLDEDTYGDGNFVIKNIYVYGNKDGTLKTSTWVKDNNKWYYLNKDGIMIKNVSEQINGKYYIFDKSGAMIEKKGWIKRSYKDGYDKYFYGNGDGTIKTNSWINDNGKWYYLVHGGQMLSNTHYYINGKDYKFDNNGVCLNP